ncbi:MAG: PD40 domain-containing protein, partial [Prevotella sp.]|nr:PD40 domain-containing protein [Prevotella sp.]
DTEKHEILSDSIVMRKYWAENCPAFSHDGKWLYFVTAKRQVYPTDYDKERYSLCRVAFDEGSGTLSDQVDTLVNCEKTGKSATWPRPSYDGKYIMYTQADYGYFSIWHPESDLWLYDLATGETHPLEKANSQQAESLHSWTANSHWFLFTSRRGDGLYSKVYLAAIDNDGNATKPFLLPQRNPKKYYTQTVYSFNTPDFTSRSVKANGRKMGRNIESDQRTNTTVNDKNLFKSNHQEEK